MPLESAATNSKPEDSMQQCYMPFGRRNNNSPATRCSSRSRVIASTSLVGFCQGGWNDNPYYRSVTTESRKSRGIRLPICNGNGNLCRVSCPRPSHRLRQCGANRAEYHGAPATVAARHGQQSTLLPHRCSSDRGSLCDSQARQSQPCLVCGVAQAGRDLSFYRSNAQ